MAPKKKSVSKKQSISGGSTSSGLAGSPVNTMHTVLSKSSFYRLTDGSLHRSSALLPGSVGAGPPDLDGAIGSDEQGIQLDILVLSGISCGHIAHAHGGPITILSRHTAYHAHAPYAISGDETVDGGVGYQRSSGSLAPTGLMPVSKGIKRPC